jgi:hypothetical protein
MTKSRALIATAWVAAGAAAVAAVPASAAAAPRLEGSSHATVKYTKLVNIHGRVNKPFHQSYFFDAKCPSGSCKRVTLTRARNQRAVGYAIGLKRVRARSYRGAFRTTLFSDGCEIRQTTKVRLRITRAADGLAKGFRARLTTTLRGINCSASGYSVEQAKGSIGPLNG